MRRINGCILIYPSTLMSPVAGNGFISSVITSKLLVITLLVITLQITLPPIGHEGCRPRSRWNPGDVPEARTPVATERRRWDRDSAIWPRRNFEVRGLVRRR